MLWIVGITSVAVFCIGFSLYTKKQRRRMLDRALHDDIVWQRYCNGDVDEKEAARLVNEYREK